LEARSIEGWLLPELAEQLGEAVQRLEERIARRRDVWREEIEGTVWIASKPAVETLVPQLMEVTQAYLRDYPAVTAVAPATLHSMVCRQLDLRIFRVLLERLMRSGELESTAEGVRPKGYRQTLSQDEAGLAHRVEELLTYLGKPLPKLEALAKEVGVPVPRLRRFLGELERAGRLARLADGVYVTQQDLVTWRDNALRYLEMHDRMTAAQFRDQINIGRGLAILVLERMDRDGITKRVGDFRVAGSAAQRGRERHDNRSRATERC
jgi:selenocysteine-specific elongation factor